MNALTFHLNPKEAVRLVAMSALLAAQFAPAFAQTPDLTGGLSYQYGLAAEALIWSPEHVFRLADGPSVLAQSVTANKAAIASVMGVVHDPTGSVALIWTPTQVFQQASGASTAAEVKFNSASTGGVRGTVFDPEGGEALIWNAGHVLLSNGGTTATEVLRRGAPIADVRGVAYLPHGGQALLWSPSKVMLYQKGQGPVEITDNGASIANVLGVVTTPDPAAGTALMWTASQVLSYSTGSSAAGHVLFAGAAIAGARGIAYHSLANTALIWTDNRILHLTMSDLSTSEVFEDYQGQPAPTLTDVRGIAVKPLWDADPPGLQMGALIWNSGHVWRYTEADNRAHQVTLNGDPVLGPIPNVQGIVWHPLGANAEIWTPDLVYHLPNGLFVAKPLLKYDGYLFSTIVNVQGVSYHPWGGHDLLWTPQHLFIHLNGDTYNGEFIAWEVTTETGASIGDIQGVVYHPGAQGVANPKSALIWTPHGVYQFINPLYPDRNYVAREIMGDGAPIFSFAMQDARFLQAVVHHMVDSVVLPVEFPHGSGFSGAGWVGSPAAATVGFAGSSVAGSVVAASTSPAAHSTVLGASHSYNADLILGPLQFSGAVVGNSMKVFGMRECSCPCHGDPKCDGVSDILDVVIVINVALRGVPAQYDPGCPVAREDLDCNGVVDVLDVVKMIGVALRGQVFKTTVCNPCP